MDIRDQVTARRAELENEKRETKSTKGYAEKSRHRKGAHMIDDEAIKHIEKLHQLKNDGIITEADFEAAKQKLLLGIPRPPSAFEKILQSHNGLISLPAEGDHIGWMTFPLKRYADFTGRSCRKEFWMYQLLYVALFFACAVFGIAIGSDAAAGLFVLCALGLLVPLIAVEVRRFHDLGKPGTYALFNLIPYLGVLIVFFFMLQPGVEDDNEYGECPK